MRVLLDADRPEDYEPALTAFERANKRCDADKLSNEF